VSVRHDAIRIVPYDSDWPALFGREREPLERALGPALVRRVEHMGSTAVPGLEAKPIIDMLAVVQDIDGVDLSAVAACGWLLAPEPGDEQERRLSLCKPALEKRTHHLHIVEKRFDAWQDWILFRDYLRHHPDTALRYAELKRQLAGAGAGDPNDRAAYRDGKSVFVEAVLEAAQAEGG
jgi:GrpB-like predicted nucleotidyltransferase (UPF0157 family)